MGQDEKLPWQTAAVTRLLEARKNGRLGSRKSRGGCRTCKTRRIKCDETHPFCNRCKSTGRECSGYGDSVPREMQKSQHQAPSADISSAFGLSRQYDKRTLNYFLTVTAPRLGGSLDKDFWCGGVLQLARAEPLIVDSLMAISLLYEHPQYLVNFNPRSTRERIENGTILSVVHEGDIFTPIPLDEYHADAIRLYNRSIRALRRRMEAGDASLLLALLSCLLFICIETIRDDLPAALELFQRGIGLLEQCAKAEVSGQERSLINNLTLIFARLGVLAAAFGHSRPVALPSACIMTGHTPHFATMYEARDELYVLMADSHAFVEDAAAYRASLDNDPDHKRPSSSIDIAVEASATSIQADGCLDTSQGSISIFQTSDGVSGYLSNDLKGVATKASNHAVNDRFQDVDNILQTDEDVVSTGAHCNREGDPIIRMTDLFHSHGTRDETTSPLKTDKVTSRLADLEKRQKILELRLDHWLKAFESAQSSSTDMRLETPSTLSMYYHVSFIWLKTRLASNQVAFDQYTYHFEQILHHAEIYIEAKAVQKPIYTFEVGAVPPLYFVITKCRTPSIRRRALQLMARAPRKECMWGATSTAQLSARIVAIEEEGMSLIPPDWAGITPNGSAISDIKLPCEEKRVHELELIQNIKSALYEVRVTRYPIIDGRRCKTVQDYVI